MIKQMQYTNTVPLIRHFTSSETISHLIEYMQEQEMDLKLFKTKDKVNQMETLDMMLMRLEQDIIEDYLLDNYEVVDESLEEEEKELKLKAFAQKVLSHLFFNQTEATQQDKHYYQAVEECLNALIRTITLFSDVNTHYGISFKKKEDFKKAATILTVCDIDFDLIN